ncbi:MAG TPA: N-acetylmuramoyl-L-alanine amidase [Solimonas sp.]|nr:N-acetylmuramoyl-L-alanine amidase [Solimonas sp.]
MRFIVFFATLMLAPTLGAAELRDLRLWESPDSTRVVFDLSAASEHKVFTLANPDRIVIDIAGLGQDSIPVANRVGAKGLVQRVRSGPREGGLRIVLDVSQPVNPKTFALEPNDDYGFRLVLDLYGQRQARSAPITKPEPPPVRLEDKPIVVAIDAGHGGEDPGARGKSGLEEKDVALAIARRLAKLINAEPNMRAVLTRDGDYYLGLRERVNIAREHNADLFLSVHANAFKKKTMRGTAVYVVSDRGATNEHARWLAHKENSADMVGGVEIQGKDQELASVLIDLSQSATMEASFDVGSRILKSMGQVNVLQKREVQQAGFMVLKAPDIPSVLVETAFITNDREEALLKDKESQDKLARAMLDGVKGYFQGYRPQQQVVEAQPGLQQVDLQLVPQRAVEMADTQGVSQ